MEIGWLTDERISVLVNCRRGEEDYEETRALAQEVQERREAEKWLPMESAPKDGTRILVDFGRAGVHAVSWDQPVGCDWMIWCVDDRKHGPHPLRGYIEPDERGWRSLPPPVDPR